MEHERQVAIGDLRAIGWLRVLREVVWFDPPKWASVYGIQRPDPIPAVLGYDEVFHAFVIAGAAAHFAAIALYIIPDAPRA